jgi:Methyltransferase domain
VLAQPIGVQLERRAPCVEAERIESVPFRSRHLRAAAAAGPAGFAAEGASPAALRAGRGQLGPALAVTAAYGLVDHGFAGYQFANQKPRNLVGVSFGEPSPNETDVSLGQECLRRLLDWALPTRLIRAALVGHDDQMTSDLTYERFADEYATHAVDSPWNSLYDRPAMPALAGDVAGLRVLDAGCGPGLYAEELIRAGAHVVECDQSPALVSRAQKRTAGAADLRVHDLSEPLTWVPEGSIDLVVCALTLHYIDDRVALLREFSRVLAPGGAVVLSTHHSTSDCPRSSTSARHRKVRRCSRPSKPCKSTLPHT